MDDEWVHIFKVSDYQRHKKGFTVYKVTSIVHPQNAPERKTEVVAWKRYSEIVTLHKQLQKRHAELNLNDEFPPLAKPRLLGRFEADVVEERRSAAHGLLEFVGFHPPLFMNQLLVRFFQESHSVSFRDNMLEGRHGQKLNLPAVPSVSAQDDVTVIPPTFNQTTPKDSHRITSAISPHLQLGEHSELKEDPCSGNVSFTLPSSVSPSQFCKNSSVAPGTIFSNHSAHECETFESAQMVDPTISSLSSAVNHNALFESGVAPVLPAQFSLIGGLKKSDTPTNAEDVNENEKLISVSQFPILDCMTEAAFHIGQAVELEINSDFEAAFCSYKSAVACLLRGVRDDSVEERKLLLQRKASLYLLKAEHIYHKYLAFSHTTTRSIPKPKHGENTWRTLEVPITNLQFFRVLGVVSSVILTCNTRNNVPYILKVLHKSDCPVNRRFKSITPTNVPFMCRMLCYMENESSIFLALELAKGGRLWNHILPYLKCCNDDDDKPGCGCVNHKSQTDSSDHDLIEQTESSPANLPLSSVDNSQVELPVINLESHTESVNIDDRNEFSTTGAPNILNRIKFEDPSIDSNKEQPSVPVASQDVLSCGASSISSADVPRTSPPHPSTVGNVAIALETEEIIQNSQKLLESDMLEGRARALSRSLDREALRLSSPALSPAVPLDTVVVWAAELALALDAIHRWGIIIGDLRPDNLLLGRGLHLMLSYQSEWISIDRDPRVSDLTYAAPELSGISRITPAADWWSYGAILFEMLSGETLASYHPGGFHQHFILNIPPGLSEDASNLLQQLLRHNPRDRLGVGLHGIAKLKSHKFFVNLEWSNILQLSASA